MNDVIASSMRCIMQSVLYSDRWNEVSVMTSQLLPRNGFGVGDADGWTAVPAVPPRPLNVRF